MITFLLYLALWLLIGLLITLYTRGVHPFSKNMRESDRTAMLIDIIVGPLGPIMFIVWLIINRNKDKDGTEL